MKWFHIICIQALLLTAIALPGCTALPAETVQVPASKNLEVTELQEGQSERAAQAKEKIDNLMRRLADEKYATREAGDKALRELLFHDTSDLCTSLLRFKYHFDTTTDPEVKTRLERVIEQLSAAWGVNKIGDESAGSPLIHAYRRKALEEAAQLVGGHVVQVNPNWLKIVVPMPMVTIKVNDANLGVVLNQIAFMGGARVVIAPDVMGKVSINLKNVPWRTAFDTIVKTLGFLVVEDDSILHVVRPEALTK